MKCSKFTLFWFLLALFGAPAVLLAQGPGDLNEGTRIEWDGTNEIFRFSWWGTNGRTYFLQHSEDLVSWDYVPIIEPGSGAAKEWGFTSTGERFFLRLRYSDQPTLDPFTADFDGDHVGNQDELNFGTDPFDGQLDSDGLSRDWKIRFLDGLDAAPGADPDFDGLTNLQEFLHYSDPSDYGNWSVPPMGDSDNNGLADWWEILHFSTLGNDPNQIIAEKGGLTLKEVFDNDLEIDVNDTVGDGIPDSWKIANGLSATDSGLANEDPDNDGLINAEEYEAGTDPNIPDTDADGALDGHDLYPLVADPSIPPSFRVAVPSWEDQYDSQDPDWSAVDYTTVELRWDSSTNAPSNYIIERRADNDLWQAVATVSGSTATHEDNGLVANRHYQYRIRAVKSNGATQVSSAFATANYRVPLNLRLHAKTASSSQSKWSYGHAEFTNPSTPPKYYFTKADVSSYTQSSSSSNSSSSGSGNYSFTRTYDPMLKKTDETGSYSTSSQSNSWGTDWSSSSSSSATSSYSSLDQARSPGNTASVTQRSSTYDSQSSSSNSWSSPTSTSSGSDGNYLFQGTYSPTDGPPLWAGSDFDMSRGTVSLVGSSSSSSYYNPSSGSGTTTSASATASGTGYYPTWVGTSTNSSGNTSSISYAPYLSGWTYSSWFSGLQSTTQTERSYSQTSGNYQYQGTQTLSAEYTTEALIATAVAHMSDYPPEWTEDYWGWGYYDWGYWGPYDYWGYDDWYYNYDYGYYWWGWGAAHWSLNEDETSISTGKFKYKLTANPSASTTLHWAEMFVPYDDYDTSEIDESLDVEIVAERTWELTGSENESPEFEIDPTQNPPTRNGYYTILFRPIDVNVQGIGEAGKDVTGDDTKPGKVVLINDGDADNDGIPDYADGYDLHPEFAEDDACSGASFVPIHIGFYAIDPENAKIKFTYSASNPSGVNSAGTNPYQLPAGGKIRLWMRDANGGYAYDPDTGDYEFSQRDGRTVGEGGDYIEPGVEYSLEDLGLDDDNYYYDYGNGFTVYAEIVKTSDAVADIPVKVEIKPNANLGYVFSDQVRFTGVAINVIAEDFEEELQTQVVSVTTSSLSELDERFEDTERTPGSFLKYQVSVSDPRQNITTLHVGTRTVPLTSQQGLYMSDPLVFSVAQLLPSSMAGVHLINPGRAPIVFSYNGEKTLPNGARVKRSYLDLDELSHYQVEAERIVTQNGFSGTPQARGTAIANKTWELMQADGKTKQWMFSVRVDDVTGKIVSIGGDPVLTPTTNPPINKTTEIDFVRMERRQNFKLGDTWNPSKIVRIHEMKNSITGSLTVAQADRQLQLIGNDLDKFFVSWGKYEVTATAQKVARRFVVRKYAFRLLGGAALAAVVFTAPAAISAQSEEMIDTLEELHRVAGNPGATSIYRFQLETQMRGLIDIISPESNVILRIPLDHIVSEDLTTLLDEGL